MRGAFRDIFGEGLSLGKNFLNFWEGSLVRTKKLISHESALVFCFTAETGDGCEVVQAAQMPKGARWLLLGGLYSYFTTPIKNYISSLALHRQQEPGGRL